MISRQLISLSLMASIERYEVLFALCVRHTRNNQNHAPLVGGAGAQVHAVGPGVHVVLVIEPTRFPSIELRAELRVHTRDRRRRERRRFPKQRSQRRLEVTLREPFNPQLMKRTIQTWESTRTCLGNTADSYVVPRTRGRRMGIAPAGVVIVSRSGSWPLRYKTGAPSSTRS